jgi:hypothetical protein
MTSDLTIDAEGVHACAAGLADTAATVRTGLHRSPPLVVTDDGWATAEAGDALVTAAARQLATIGAAIADTADRLHRAATDYEAADDRAAARLRTA